MGKLHNFRKNMTGNKKAISLIELMLTVVILSIGIVMILKSFLSVNSALGYTKNKIVALQFLDGKMAQLQEAVLKGEDILEQEDQADVRINGKNFTWMRDLFSLAQENEDSLVIRGVNWVIQWKEGAIDKQQTLAAYINFEEED